MKAYKLLLIAIILLVSSCMEHKPLAHCRYCDKDIYPSSIRYITGYGWFCSQECKTAGLKEIKDRR